MNVNEIIYKLLKLKAMTIRDLEPKLIWEQFDDITRVPRPSKKEEKIIAWLVEFAEKHNIDYQTDERSA